MKTLRLSVIVLLLVASGCGLFLPASAREAKLEAEKKYAALEADLAALRTQMKARAAAFPWERLIGFVILGAIAGAACLLAAPVRPLAGIAVAACWGVGVLVTMQAFMWHIIAAVALVAGLTFLAMWVRRSKQFKSVVRGLQAARDDDAGFKTKMNKAMTPVAPKGSATAKVINKMKAKA